MAKLLPPRPHYAKERALYPYPILAAFLLLFAARIAAKRIYHIISALFCQVNVKRKTKKEVTLDRFYLSTGQGSLLFALDI